MTRYLYGMRLRGFSPGCQPMNGLVDREDGGKKYWDILVYKRLLTDYEKKQYSLDYIGRRLIDSEKKSVYTHPERG